MLSFGVVAAVEQEVAVEGGGWAKEWTKRWLYWWCDADVAAGECLPALWQSSLTLTNKLSWPGADHDFYGAGGNQTSFQQGWGEDF